MHQIISSLLGQGTEISAVESVKELEQEKEDGVVLSDLSYSKMLEQCYLNKFNLVQQKVAQLPLLWTNLFLAVPSVVLRIVQGNTK